MIAAFIASASLSLIAAFFCLLLYSNATLTHSNPFDRFFRRKLCLPLQCFVGAARASAWSNMLYGTIMALSDQQLITGIAILSAAIRSLDKRTITVYHFNMVMNMAWFSSNVHLISLCVMRSFLYSSQIPNVLSHARSHAVLPRALRIIAMLVLAGLLLHCSAVSGYELWDNNPNCPALCITRGQRAGYPYRQMIVTFVFVIQSYTFQIARVTPAVGRFCSERILPIIQKCDDSALNKSDKRSCIQSVYRGTRRVALIIWWLLTSDLEFMLEMVAWYIIGLYWMFSDRNDGHRHMEGSEIWKENHIGFGQLVPLLLIVLGTLAGMEAYLCKFYLLRYHERIATDIRGTGRNTFRGENVGPRRESDSSFERKDLKPYEVSTGMIEPRA
jgi:hypothetical protein